MKHFILFLFCCLFALCVQSQSSFELFGSIRYEGEIMVKSDPQTRTFTSFLPIDTSFSRRTTSKRTSQEVFELKPKLAIQLGIDQYFRLAEDLEFSVGIHGLFHSFDFGRSTETIDFNIISVDTVMGSSIFPIGPSRCDIFESNGASFTDFKPKQTIGYLRIPIGLKYKLPGVDQSSIQVNGFFQTPIYYGISTFSSTFEIEEVNGMNKCISTGIISDSHRAGNQRPLVIGASLGLSYMFNDQLGVRANVEKTFNGLFDNSASNGLSFNSEIRSDNYNPIVISAGFTYRLGKQSVEE